MVGRGRRGREGAGKGKEGLCAASDPTETDQCIVACLPSQPSFIHVYCVKMVS